MWVEIYNAVRRFSRSVRSVYEQSVTFSFYKPEVFTLAFRIVMFLAASRLVWMSIASNMLQGGVY